MDIFEFAKEKEQYAQDFYRDLASRSQEQGLKKIFNMLADEEEKHFEIIEKMQSETPDDLAETTVLSDAVEVFEKMREGAKKFKLDLSQVALYQKAQEIEKQAQEYYLEKAREVKQTAQRDIFLKLANEEKKHYILLDNIIEFVSRPQQWLENAEFHHLEEY